MQKRRDIINKTEPHLVVSVHMNKYSSSSRRGAQVFYKNGDSNSKLLADSIQESFNNMKEASRECFILTGDYYILNCTKYNSVLIECGFISNPEEERLLITQDYCDKLMYSVYCGIMLYLGF